jgi:nucleoside-diphosphate-sugar epimerase
MNVVVTGASGFFGSALVRALLERGDAVRALVRRPEAAAELRAAGAETVLGDLTAPGGCDGLVSAGDVVIHTAARVDMSGRWKDFRRTTVEGTRNLLAAALPRGPRRFVYISSGAVYAPTVDPGGFCAERTPARPPRYNFYGRAKLVAESLVRAECERVDCPWTIVRLGFLYGAGNRALLQHLAPLARRNKLFIVGNGENRIATLYVDDAVRATLLAATHPQAAGKIYDVASAEPVTQREFLDATTWILGLPRTRRRISRGAAFVGAWLIEQWSHWANRQPHISRAAVALMSTDQFVDTSRIRREVGWRPEVSFAEGTRRMRESYTQAGAPRAIGEVKRASASTASAAP